MWSKTSNDIWYYYRHIQHNSHDVIIVEARMAKKIFQKMRSQLGNSQFLLNRTRPKCYDRSKHPERPFLPRISRISHEKCQFYPLYFTLELFQFSPIFPGRSRLVFMTSLSLQAAFRASQKISTYKYLQFMDYTIQN